MVVRCVRISGISATTGGGRFLSCFIVIKQSVALLFNIVYVSERKRDFSV